MSQSNIIARDKAAPVKSGAAAVRRANRARILRPVLMIGGILLVIIVALVFWLTGGRYVSSDDSYVDAAKVSLSTDVSGLVDQVFVRDNQHVDAGQELFSVGQTQYGISVAAAQAQLAQAVLNVQSSKRGYNEALDETALQQIQITKDKTDLARYAAVVRDGGVTKSTYDDAQFKLEGDETKLTQLQDEAGVQLVKLQDNANIDPSQTPAYQSALAQLDTAKLNQAHSIVRAPFSGTVTMVEELQPGMFLPAGTAAFGLVSDTDVWITAQPKESDLTWVRTGQAVTITVDTYPNETWNGLVESISPASGSEFSILPAQNSSGNWVKVVQRVPVRVKITGGPSGFALRDGMSAEISIDTQHHRHFSDLF